MSVSQKQSKSEARPRARKSAQETQGHDRMARVCGQLIHRLRRERGLSQKELAERAALHPSAPSLWELGKHAPSIWSLLKVARALQYDPKKLSNRILLAFQRAEVDELIAQAGRRLRASASARRRTALEAFS